MSKAVYYMRISTDDLVGEEYSIKDSEDMIINNEKSLIVKEVNNE